jgi:hypothetical protein
MEKKEMAVEIRILGILLILYPLYRYLIVLPIYLIRNSIPLTQFLKYIVRDFSKNQLSIYNLLFIICGMGVLQFKEWARKLTVYLSILGLFLSVFFIHSPLRLHFMVIYLASCVFLFIPKVKEQFK